MCFKEVSFPLLIFKEGTVDHHRYHDEVLVVPLKFGNETTERFSKMAEGPIFIKKLLIGVGLIFHLSLIKIIDL